VIIEISIIGCFLCNLRIFSLPRAKKVYFMDAGSGIIFVKEK